MPCLKRHALFKRLERCLVEMHVACECSFQVVGNEIKLINMVLAGEEQAARVRYNELTNGEFMVGCGWFKASINHEYDEADQAMK